MLLRREHGLLPVYKMIDTCASEFDSYVPYFYSTYEEENESVVVGPQKDHRAGQRPHPHRPGRGVRLLHRARHLDHPGERATRPSSSTTTRKPSPPTTPPATSSTLSRSRVEDVMNVIDAGKARRASSSRLGGQTAINLAEPPARAWACSIIGTDVEAIEQRGKPRRL